MRMQKLPMVAVALCGLMVCACKEEEKPVVIERDTPAPRGAVKNPSPDAAKSMPSAGPISPDSKMPAGHPPIGDASQAPAAPDKPLVEAKPGTLTAAGLTMSVPESWKSVPASGMRLAQYAVPGKGGDADFVVFCFGRGQGGPIDANVNRWVSQFSNPDKPDEDVKSERESFDQGGLKITLVKARGSYSNLNMTPQAGTKSEPLANQALYGIIIEGSDAGNVFIKVTGPAETVDEQAGALEKVARSIKAAK